MLPLSPASRLFLLALAGSLLVAGCARHRAESPAALGIMGGDDKATLETIELSQPTSAGAPITKMKLAYEHGAKLDLKFSSQKFNIENMAVKTESGSGITLDSGAVSVKAADLPVARAAAPRFWPIIRRQRVVVGAEGTEFVVQAISQPPGSDGRTLIAKVQMVSGTRVFIDAPGDADELKDPGSQAHVYLRRDGVNHDIEVLRAVDAELQNLVAELTR